MSEPVFESKRRWPGAPPFCNAAVRLAFKDVAAIRAYRALIGMAAYSPERIWFCKFCQHLHYDGRVPNPSGDSSGTGRSSKAG